MESVAAAPALLVTESVALYVKTSGGVNTIWKVQLCCTARLAGQLLVWVYVPFDGMTENPVRFTGAEPSLVSVALSALLEPTAILPKFSGDGVNPRARVSPVPVRAITCVGLPGLLSFKVTLPVRTPFAVGVNTIVIAQL